MWVGGEFWEIFNLPRHEETVNMTKHDECGEKNQNIKRVLSLLKLFVKRKFWLLDEVTGKLKISFSICLKAEVLIDKKLNQHGNVD